MAGRGRGASFTFNIEALGIGRGSMPDARVGPSPLFPPTDLKPVPLKAGEEEDYMLALKQEMRGTMQRLPYNLKPRSNRVEVEKYTQRYLKQSQNDEDWTPDWNLFPKELMPRKRRVGAEAGFRERKARIFSTNWRKTTTSTAISTMGKTLPREAMTIWTAKRPTEPSGSVSGWNRNIYFQLSDFPFLSDVQRLCK
ncbi:unnamed protein product [Tetraodon nigroviridis]|uniref:(spotted green pufferfish) hypothetical protein n=1 Tax=Tetraodon nigroviridis TaxID=99883 RepID=Q4SG45_TETNG|nr:unnamed protein product [Tetraodon nigroviridis]